LSDRAYRKKPVVIEAMQFDGTKAGIDAVCEFIGYKCGYSYRGDGEYELWIKTLEGGLTASPLDWIIRGVKGEYYPCKPDIFEATYEPAALAVGEEPAIAASRPEGNYCTADKDCVHECPANAPQARIDELKDAVIALCDLEFTVEQRKAYISNRMAHLRALLSASPAPLCIGGGRCAPGAHDVSCPLAKTVAPRKPQGTAHDLATIKALIKNSLILARGRFVDGEFFVDQVVADLMSVEATIKAEPAPAGSEPQSCDASPVETEEEAGGSCVRATRSPASSSSVQELREELLEILALWPPLHDDLCKQTCNLCKWTKEVREKLASGARAYCDLECTLERHTAACEARLSKMWNAASAAPVRVGEEPSERCKHERLTEEGVCRKCGEDCRGIHS
jgi:hypothetical protein